MSERARREREEEKVRTIERERRGHGGREGERPSAWFRGTAITGEHPAGGLRVSATGLRCKGLGPSKRALARNISRRQTAITCEHPVALEGIQPPNCRKDSPRQTPMALQIAYHGVYIYI